MLEEIRLGPALDPRLTHDCEECTFVGYMRHNGIDYDVWLHERGNGEEAHVIKRYGNDGADYKSFDEGLARKCGGSWADAMAMVDCFRALKG